MPGRAKPGDSHRFAVQFGRNGAPQRRDSESPRLRIAPLFSPGPMSFGVFESAMGCLTYSRRLYLSREYLYMLWPESAKGTVEETRCELRAASCQPAHRPRVVSRRTTPCQHAPGVGIRTRQILPFDGTGGTRTRQRAGRRRIRRRRLERYINVFELSLRHDATAAQRCLNEIVARLSGMFTTERVDEGKRLSELTGSHDKTGAVDGPWGFHVHSPSSLGGGLVLGFPVLVSGF